jgi:hypothetical protein
MRRRVTSRGAVRQPIGSRRRRMGRGPLRSRPARAPQGRPARAPQGRPALEKVNAPSTLAELFKRRRAAGKRRPTQRLTAQQRARLAAQRRAKTPKAKKAMQAALKRRRTILGQAKQTGSSKRKPTQKMMAQQLAVMRADKQKTKQTPVRSGISVTGKKAPRPSVDLRRGVSRITSGRRPKRRA